MPKEKTPSAPLPVDFKPAGGVAYRVKDGDDWNTIARQAGVEVTSLLQFNFKTRVAEEINWYLRRNVGCKKASPDGLNWRFSADAQPGIIYLPPSPGAAGSTRTLEVKVGTVSWISAKTNPMLTTIQGKALDPEWIPQTFLGLVATANDTPPASISDFPAFATKKDFRALMHCDLRVDIDGTTDRVTRFEVVQALFDPGWTPPFKLRNWPLAAVASTETWSNEYHRGEADLDSQVGTRARHPKSAILGVPGDEQVLVNGLIKFRAGKHTDDVGVNEVHTPYHVPWVWCEMLLTYRRGKLKLYGQGSMFPSHAWYVDGKQVQQVAEVSDSNFPIKPVCYSRPSWANPMAPSICLPTNNILVESMNLYAVLTTGASAEDRRPQMPKAKCVGPVNKHPHTVKGGRGFSLAL